MIIFFETKNKSEVVSRFYELEDEYWHRNVHKYGGTVEENIKDTLATISPNSKMYIVNSGSALAAFFVKYNSPECQAIEGFHIAKQYRNKDFFIKFWSIVRSVFDGLFYIGIFENNVAAIRHLEEQGFLRIKDVFVNGKNYVLLSSTT